MRSTRKAGKAQPASTKKTTSQLKQEVASKPIDVREAGRKGGRIRALQHDGMVGEGKMSIEEAGRKGGGVVASKYGGVYFQRIGQYGGLARTAASDVEVITEKFLTGKTGELGIPPMTKKFQSVYDEYTKVAGGFRANCRLYIEKAWKALRSAGYDEPFLRPYARSIIEGTAQKIGYGDRIILLYLPDELKDSVRALAGSKGGQSVQLTRQYASGFGSSGSGRGFSEESSQVPNVAEEEGAGGEGIEGASGSNSRNARPPLVSWSAEYGPDFRAIIEKAMDEADAKGATSMTMSFRGRRLESADPVMAIGRGSQNGAPESDTDPVRATTA